MKPFPTAVLMAATLITGLVSGVFVLYAHTIMPGLGKTDDRTFVRAFQATDRAIINPWFMSMFFGALVLAALAGVLELQADSRPALWWIVAAFVLYLIAVIITFSVHLPLNDAIKAAGNPDHIRDLAGVRERFDEARWTAWNIVRSIASTAAFGCLLWALVLYARK
jgi:uncharacterized membrane protein